MQQMPLVRKKNVDWTGGSPAISSFLPWHLTMQGAGRCAQHSFQWQISSLQAPQHLDGKVGRKAQFQFRREETAETAETADV